MKCLKCGKRAYSEYCLQHKKRKPITKYGKEAKRYTEFRKEVAIPYLDRQFGHKCRMCSRTDGLELDHIHSRGSRPELKYQISNLQWLCFDCHRKKTDRL